MKKKLIFGVALLSILSMFTGCSIQLTTTSDGKTTTLYEKDLGDVKEKAGEAASDVFNKVKDSIQNSEE